jgi:hypothetical protein
MLKRLKEFGDGRHGLCRIEEVGGGLGRPPGEIAIDDHRDEKTP